MDKEYVISILKSALIVQDGYKNELIRDAIKAIDSDEYDKMEKEFSEMLDDIKNGNISKYMI